MPDQAPDQTYPRPYITVSNVTPSRWEAVITEVFIRFIFQKWTGEPNDELRMPTRIATGGQQEFHSQIESCCVGYACVVTVKDKTGNVQTFNKMRNMPNDRACMTHDILVLGGSARYVDLDADQEEPISITFESAFPEQ